MNGMRMCRPGRSGLSVFAEPLDRPVEPLIDNPHGADNDDDRQNDQYEDNNSTSFKHGSAVSEVYRQGCSFENAAVCRQTYDSDNRLIYSPPMSHGAVFHETYKERPYWWEAYAPEAPQLEEVPETTRVAVIGAGYAGLATALELSRLGIEATVLDAAEPGYGASTRSGGLVDGGPVCQETIAGQTTATGPGRCDRVGRVGRVQSPGTPDRRRENRMWLAPHRPLHGRDFPQAFQKLGAAGRTDGGQMFEASNLFRASANGSSSALTIAMAV